MKCVKVRIRRGGPTENLMVYPGRYRAVEVDRNGFGPSGALGMAYSGHIGRGGNEEWCIICLNDSLADTYAKDPDMEIVSPDAVDTMMTEWMATTGVPEEYVGDPNRLQAIVTKKALDIPLSAEDMKALDPDDDCPGLNKRTCDIRKAVGKGGNKITE